MEWMVTNSQVQATFALLGTRAGDVYHVNEGYLEHLNEILDKLSTEDQVFRTFRRAIGFSQVIKKDLLPLLCCVKDDNKAFNVVVKILGSLTVPVECLMDINILLKTDSGRTIVYELNWLLTSCKEAFLDPRVTRAILDFIKFILDKEESVTGADCEGVNNCLLLLRNILHIPEVRGGVPGNGISHQNQIVWNMFTQSMDKVLIQLMTGAQRAHWGMAVVQLVALIYKDQHVGTLQKLLSLWFEASLSESSEDNESNTSPPDRGSGDSSSSMNLSDSSDNGNGSGGRQRKHTKSEGNENGSSSSGCSSGGKGHAESKQNHSTSWIPETGRKHPHGNRKHASNSKAAQLKKDRNDPASDNSHFEVKSHHSAWSWTSSEGTGALSRSSTGTPKKDCTSEVSDCGYGTQADNQESISTSSNEDEASSLIVKPVHQKPSYLMQKTRHPARKVLKLQEKELRRKRLIKRSKTNTMNMKALLHHQPSDEDISHLLKEFTVDFLLKGYGRLVGQLHAQLLTCAMHAHIDTSHFFWLVTYFLKFAAQLELDLEHVSPVLSYETVSYLTFEGAHLSEQLQLLRMRRHSDLTPCLRRLHLVVTALREVLQALQAYKKISHLSKDDEISLVMLQDRMFSSGDLRSLFLLLLRKFDPTIQSKQYLQDIIVTNHILLIFMENYSQSSSCVHEYFQHTSLANLIKQFACDDIMKQYGLLLEYFEENGEFVNNCIFTMMHHTAGDIDQVDTLFQPAILKTYFKIWESDFEICDDWSDLIEYVVHKFVNLQHKLPVPAPPDDLNKLDKHDSEDGASTIGWSVNDSRNLPGYYVQSASSSDPIGDVLNFYTETGIVNKTRIGVIGRLLKQDVINDMEFHDFIKKEPNFDEMSQILENETTTQTENQALDEIKVLKDHLVNENKEKFVIWLKECLLEACHAKLSLTHKMKLIVEPISYHYALLQQSIPLVSWTTGQEEVLQYQPFVLLLDKLGLHLPSDTRQVYVRIPHFWTADVIYSVAQKLGPSSAEELKFDIGLLEGTSKSLWIPDTGTFTEIHPTTEFSVSNSKHSSSFIGYTPGPNLYSNWMDIVKSSKVANKAPSEPSTLEENEEASMSCDTDLTQMCVSDEEHTAPPQTET